jgi:triosephosphate isomerase
MNRHPLMAGNWKMHKTVAQARSFIDQLAPLLKNQTHLPEVVICPPFTSIPALAQLVELLPVALGAQTMESRDSGAYTGEISPVMLADFDVEYVILGHSERRAYYNETDEAVNAKTLAALAHGLTPIICVGESLEQREAGETDAVVLAQVQAALQNVDAQRVVFAYEPIWAIGTGKVCEDAEANRVCGLIRAQAHSSTRVLYGGSAKPDNIVGLMAQGDIDGALVGGASLEADSFFKMIQAAAPVAAL